MAVLGLLVCIAALVARCSIGWIERNSYNEDTWYPSPDGKYIARYVMKAADDSISAFCTESVQVYPAAMAHLPEAQKTEPEIYRSACQSVAIDGRDHVRWTADDILTLRVLPGDFPGRPRHLWVDVEFKIKE